MDFFRGRHSWRKLWLILDRLPMSSAYREAVLDDPEIADELARRPEAKGPGRPRLSEFGSTDALLSDILDRLGDLYALTVQAHDGKPPRIPPAPRPTTGVERARKRLEDSQFALLEAEFTAAQERWSRNRREASDA